MKTQPAPQPENTCSVRPSYNRPDRQRVQFDNPRLIADVDLLPATLAGGDCIDDVAALRAGATVSVLGQRVAAPSPVITFRAQLRLGRRPSAERGRAGLAATRR